MSYSKLTTKGLNVFIYETDKAKDSVAIAAAVAMTHAIQRETLHRSLILPGIFKIKRVVDPAHVTVETVISGIPKTLDVPLNTLFVAEPGAKYV